MRKYIVLLMMIVLPVAGGYLGRYAAPALAHSHPTVRLAWDVRMQESDPTMGPTIESVSIGKQTRTRDQLYSDADDIRKRFALGSVMFGVWCGIVIGFTIFDFNRERRRVIYEINSDACVACARCFNSCPVRKKSPPQQQSTGATK